MLERRVEGVEVGGRIVVVGDEVVAVEAEVVVAGDEVMVVGDEVVASVRVPRSSLMRTTPTGQTHRRM